MAALIREDKDAITNPSGPPNSAPADRVMKDSGTNSHVPMIYPRIKMSGPKEPRLSKALKTNALRLSALSSIDEHFKTAVRHPLHIKRHFLGIAHSFDSRIAH